MSVIQFHPNSPAGELPATSGQQLMRLLLDEIEIDPQVRNDFKPEDLAKLGASLEKSGQITPILTYYHTARGRYVLIDGERRYRAARDIGWNALDAIVFDVEPTPKDIVLVQLVIDEQREELDPIDKGQGYANALEATGWNASELAAHIGVSHTTVTRTISLLSLPGDLQTAIRSGELPAKIARELVRLEKEPLIRTAWERVKTEGLNAEQTQKLVAKLLKSKPKTGRPKSKDKHVYKNLSGYEATVTPKKITLVPMTSGKPKTPEQMLAALEMLLAKLREDIARNTAKDANGSQPADPHMAEPASKH